MRKPRKLHPIVQVAQSAASELNDLLNAVGLRISLMRHELESSAYEAEMARLAVLIDKASQRVQRLEQYARAEELVASMRPSRTRKSSSTLGIDDPHTALLITDSSEENSAIKECLERSGCTVVVAASSADGLKLLESSDDFDRIIYDSAFLPETGGKFAAELSRAARASHVYVLERHRMSDQAVEQTE